MFQAVSPSVRSYVSGCGTCGGETGKRTRLSGVLCIFPASITPPMHHTLDSSICHWPYEILATGSFIKHNTSPFTEHIHRKPCTKRSESLTDTSTPSLRYVLFGQIKWHQRCLIREVHTPLPIQGYRRRSPK